ncbi:MAG TPA: restriction endonuclease subunit S [Pseudomonas pachastrellae]|nr:restriction endonuclease subunit S [Halopseudomonas pachastrellae]
MNPSVKVGQVQTDVGLIPMDWNITRIDAHCSIKTGSRNTQDKVEGGAYPFYVRSQQVERINSYSYDGEAVLTAGDGVGTGKVFHYINGKFDVHQRVYRISDFSDHLHGRYFFYQFSTRFYERIMSMTAKSSVDSVRMEMIAGMQIPLPPVHEQAAIASALDDIDALLSSLDQLIAKKRDIQQASMQQLLTGQRRLPRFSDEWKVKRLGEIANIKTGSKNNQDKIEDGEYPFYVRSATVERINSYSHDCEAILVPGEGNIGSIFHYVNGKFDVHQRVYAITQFAENVSGKYVHLYMSVHFGSHAMQNSVKATVDSLRLPTFQVFEVLLPPTKEEQAAIAEVLTNMNTELATLEARRDKARQIKQGMMQELLTGRIRLL